MITTVTGDITRDKIDYLLPHEHVFFDMCSLVSPIDDKDFNKKLSLSNFGKVTRNPYAILDNAVMDEDDIQVKELKTLKDAGCNLLVDATTGDFGRNPLRLRDISKHTGVFVVAGCGWYTDASVNDEAKDMSEELMFEKILCDIECGIDGTDIKAGVIGEIGTSGKMTPFEIKSVKAAARVQKKTNLGMHIHADLWSREGLKALEIALSEGANPEKVCVNHTDVLLDKEYIFKVLEQGALIEFDNFGKEFYVDRKNRNLLQGSFATDVQRVEFISMLIEKGYEKQILVTNDICLKSMTHAYGGWGYDHVITNIIPMMKDFGITDDCIELIMKDNPLRFLEK